MSGYIGNVPVPQVTQTRDTFTATAGQTSFATSGYTPGYLDVYLNGVHLVNGTDYTATNSSDVVLTTGAALNDIVQVVSFSTFTPADQTFTGDFSVDSPTFVVDSTNNRVGVGTATPSDTFEVSGNIVVTGTVDGRDVAADGSKLDGIEAGATADQTITAGTGLTGGGTGNVTLNVDVGTTANKIIQLDGTAKLPAVDGSQLTGIEGVPSGVIALWSGSTASIPSGWVLCDGNNSTPDLRDRFIVGAGSTYAVDATGGSNTVALSTAEMPSHTHSGTTDSDGSHNHTGSTSNTGSHVHTAYRFSFASGAPTRPSHNAASTNGGIADSTNTAEGAAGSHSHNLTINSAGSHTHTFTTSSSGSGSAHENRPPYYALAYIMKT